MTPLDVSTRARDVRAVVVVVVDVTRARRRPPRAHAHDAHAWEIIPTPRARAMRVYRRERRAERRGHGAMARDRLERAIGDDADARDDRGGGRRRWVSRCVTCDGVDFV